MSHKYQFTIFTPCYNSEKFIHRVIESCESQTFKDFEWLIINDASTDSTAQILENYAKTADFPIRIIHNPENKMLYYNFNLAFELAQGELMVFAGHDDRFHPETLEDFAAVWERFKSDSISGIWCMCQDQNGNLIGNRFPSEITISNYFSMFVDYIYKKERFGCTRTEVLKENKFDLNSGYVSETYLWERIGYKYQTIYLNKVLRTYYIEPDNLDALTKRKRETVSLSIYLSYLDWVNIYLYRIKGEIIFKLRYYFALAFYGLVANISISTSLNSINKTHKKLLFLSFLPIAFIVYFSMKVSHKL